MVTCSHLDGSLTYTAKAHKYVNYSIKDVKGSIDLAGHARPVEYSTVMTSIVSVER